MRTLLTALVETKSLASVTADPPMSIFRDLVPVDYFTIAAIAVGAALAVGVLRRAMPRLIAYAPARWRHHLLPFTTILRVVIYVAALWQITALFLAPTEERLLALLGVAAIAVGFGLKDYANSLIAGVVVLFERPYRLGDRVKIGDTYGEVRAMNLRSVKLVTPEDTAVYIPHSRIWESAVYNANDGIRTMLCIAKFYLHPEHDGELVRERLVDVARASTYTDNTQPIAVVAMEEPWGTRYSLKAYVIDSRDEFAFITDLTLRAKAVFARIGVRPAPVPAIGWTR